MLHLLARRADRVPEAIAQSMAQLRMIRPAFEALGVRAAIENLGKESHTSEFYDALLGEFSPDSLGFCYDSGHAILSNQADLLARYADRLLATHLHDNDGTKDQHRMPGAGKVDWSTIVSTLKESGYAGPVNQEIGLPAGTNLDVFCRQGYQTLSRLWASQVPI